MIIQLIYFPEVSQFYISLNFRLPKFKEEIKHMVHEAMPICISRRLCCASKRSRSSSREIISSRRQSSVHCNEFQKHQDSFKISKTAKQTKSFDDHEMEIMQHHRPKSR